MSKPESKKPSSDSLKPKKSIFGGFFKGDKKKQDIIKWPDAEIAAQAKASIDEEKERLRAVDKGFERLEATQERFEIFTNNLRKKSTAQLQELAEAATKRNDPKIWGISKTKAVEENPVTRAVQHIFLDSRNTDWAFHTIARSHLVYSVEMGYYEEDYGNTFFYDKDNFGKLLKELLKQEIARPARERIVDVLKIYDLIVIALVIAQKEGNGELVEKLTNVLYAGIRSKENFFDPELYKSTAQILASVGQQMTPGSQEQTLMMQIAAYISSIEYDLQAKMEPYLKYQKDLAEWNKKWDKKNASQIKEPKPEEPRAEEYPKIQSLIAQFKADNFNQAYFMQLVTEEFPGLDQFQSAQAFIREEILVGDLKSGRSAQHPIYEKVLEYFSLLGPDNPLLKTDPKYYPQAIRDKFLNKLLGVAGVEDSIIIFNKNLKEELVAIIVDHINDLMLQEPLPVAPDFAGLKDKLLKFSKAKKEMASKTKDKLDVKEGKERKKEETQKPGEEAGDEKPSELVEIPEIKEEEKESKDPFLQMAERAKASKTSHAAKKIEETGKRVEEYIKELRNAISSLPIKQAVDDIVNRDDPEKWKRKGITQRFLSSSKTSEGSERWAYYDTARSVSKSDKKSPNTILNLQAEVSQIDLNGIYYGRAQAFGLAIDDINLKDNEAAQRRSIMVCKIHEIMAALIASNDYPELREYLDNVLYSSVATCEDFYDTKLYSDAAKFIKDRIRQGDKDGSLTGETRAGLLHAASAISLLNQKLAENLKVSQDAIESEKLHLQSSFAAINDNLTEDLAAKLIARNKNFEKLITSDQLINMMISTKDNPAILRIMEYLAQPENKYINETLIATEGEEGGMQPIVLKFLANILNDENTEPPSLILYNKDRLEDAYKIIIGFLNENPKEQLDPENPLSLGLTGNGFRAYVDQQIRAKSKDEKKSSKEIEKKSPEALSKLEVEEIAAPSSTPAPAAGKKVEDDPSHSQEI